MHGLFSIPVPLSGDWLLRAQLEGHGPSWWAVSPVLILVLYLCFSVGVILYEKFTGAEVEKELNQMFKILCISANKKAGVLEQELRGLDFGPVSSVILSESFKLSGEDGLNDLVCSLNFQSYYSK